MDYVDYVENENGEYVPYSSTTYPTPYDYAGRSAAPDPTFETGLGDTYDLITALLNDLTAGNRARVAAESLILAGVARDPARLRQLAESNAPVEQYMAEIDMRALVMLIRDTSAESVVSGAQTAAQYAVTFGAGFLSKYVWDRIQGK